jgi:hypothetical protein
MPMVRVKNSVPAVQPYGDEIAVWVADDDDSIGFILEREAAFDLAFRLLRTIADARDGLPLNLAINSIATERADDVREDMAARLVVDAYDAPLAIPLSATHLAELAAALSALSLEVG